MIPGCETIRLAILPRNPDPFMDPRWSPPSGNCLVSPTQLISYLLKHSKHLIHITIVFIDRRQCKIAIHANNIYWFTRKVIKSLHQYLLIYFFILCEFHIMHTNLTHLPSLHICLLHLQPSCQIKKMVSKKYLNMEAGMCLTVVDSISILLPKQFYLQMFAVISCWSGFKAYLSFASLSIMYPYPTPLP